MTIHPPHILLEGFPGWRMSTKRGEVTGQRATWWINSWENNSCDNKFDCLWELPGFSPEDLAHLNPKPGHSNIVEKMWGKEMGTWDENDDGKFMAMIRAEIYWFFFFFFTVFQDFRASLLAQMSKNMPAMQETSVQLGIGYPLQYSWASLVAQLVKNPPAMQETWVLSLGQEDPLEKGMATHSSILAWRIPRTEEPDGLQSMGAQNQTRLSH